MYKKKKKDYFLVWKKICITQKNVLQKLSNNEGHIEVDSSVQSQTNTFIEIMAEFLKST